MAESSGTVSIDFQGDSRKVEEALARLEQRYENLKAQMKKPVQTGIGEGLRQADDSLLAWMTGGVSATAAVAAGYKAVCQQIEEMRRLQAEARTAQLPAAAANESLISAIALAGRGKTDIQAALADVERIASAGGVERVPLTQAYARTYPVGGVGTGAIMEMLSRVVPGKVEQFGELGVAIANMQKFAGGDPKQAYGLLMNIVGRSALISPEGQMQRIPAQLLDMTRLGLAPGTAAGLFETMTQLQPAERGTPRLAAAMTETMHRFAPRAPAEEMLARLQADPRLRRIFLEGGRTPWLHERWAGAGTEAGLYGELLTPGSAGADLLAANVAAYPGGAAGGLVDRFVAARGLSPFANLARASRTGESVLGEAALRDVEGGQRAEIRERLPEVMRRMSWPGLFGIGRYADVKWWDLTAKGSGAAEAIEMLEPVVESRRRALTYGYPGAENQRIQEQVRVGEEYIDVLKDIRDGIRRIDTRGGGSPTGTDPYQDERK